VRTTNEILERIHQRVDCKLVNDAGELRNLIREHLLEVLQGAEKPVRWAAAPPTVIMMVGVNGVGKTTTTGKLRPCSSAKAVA
jgi:fused signal recognition particle receptor